MTEELSPADRSALAAERGPINMAVGGLIVFEAEPRLTRTMLAERIAERIHFIPRLRQRLEEPPLGIANPVWTDDTAFDLDWHVRQASLPADSGEPGGELSRFVGREFSHRLDRSRPLWEMTLVEGLPEGRTAVMMKAHHALVDGLAAIGMAALILDPGPEPLVVDAPDTPWEPQRYDGRRHLRRLVTAPMQWAARPMVDSIFRAMDPDPRRAAADARKAAQDLRRGTDVAIELARQRPQAPMLPLNRTISPNRRYATAVGELAAVKRAGKLAGGTVNDVLLAIVAETLGDYLRAAGDRQPGNGTVRAPVALVPVSIRADRDGGGELGNRISTVFVDLPVDEPDLATRVRLINAQTRELKESAAVRAGALMVGASGLAPPLLSGLLARAMGSVRAFNLVVSNVPGPQQPFYLAGVRALEIYPVVPLNPANQGLTVGIVSYDGRVCFGMLADRDLDPPLSAAAAGLRASLDDLVALAS